MTEDSKNLTCKSCSVENPTDSAYCKKCGEPLNDTTDFLEFDFKPHHIIGDRYEIIQEIGRGAMGIVYKAFDKKLERYVALKTLKFDQKRPVKIVDLRRRMILEAKAAAKLEHPNILVIHDVIDTDMFFIHIAMELIDDISLGDIIVPDGIDDYDKIIDIIIQICDAMSHAHEKGIIHRDLKPANILLKNKRVVKITDFGIAKIITDTESMICDRGLIMGTVPYMSPERFEVIGDNPRSDIYAIGVILYELLTGTKPFSGQNQAELIFNIQNREYEPVGNKRKDVLPFFETVLSKTLAKKTSARFQTAGDLKKELLDNYKEFIKKARETQKTVIWNVPINRNVNFTGRDDILKEIRDKFTSKEPGSNILAIHGLGGMGKTQIALKYTLRHAKDYSIIWWIRSEELSSLTSEFSALASKLDLPVKFLKENEIIENLKRWLKENTGWLLIFDNAIGPDDIKGYIPESESGHILITSRNPKWGGIASTIPIKNLLLDESISFLQKRTKDTDENSARGLANALGNLPLALEQAGAYIEGSGRSIADYLTLFQKHHEKLLSRGKPANYPDTVATTWELSFKKLNDEFPAGVDLLNLLAFFAPDDIPMKIISDGAKHLPDSLAKIVSDPIDFDDTVSAMRSYSLIDRAGDSISLHRLVQTITRDRLVDEEKKSWIDIVIKIMNDAFIFDEDNVETWKVCAVLLPHVHTSVEISEINDIISSNTGELLYLTGLYLKNRGNFAEAENSLKQALFINEKVYGLKHNQVAKVSRKLGLTNYDLGNLEEAQKYIEQAFDIDEEIFGSNHPEVALDANALGTILWALNNLDKAKALFEKALSINKNAYGSVHSEIANNYNNLGLILERMNDNEGALEHHNHAFSIRVKIYGASHPKVARSLHNLCHIHRKVGNYDKSRELINEILKIEESLYGPNHPSIANTLINKGLIARDLGNLQEALELFKKAITIHEKLHGQEHPEYARDLTYIGDVLCDLGNIKEARNYFERALSIMKRKYRPDHPNITNLKNRLKLVQDK